MISHTYSSVGNSDVHINYYTGSEDFRDLAIYNTNQYSVISALEGYLNSGGSDSYSFWSMGFPAVYFEERDFSPYYHSPSDIISNYDMDYCAEVIKSSCATLISSTVVPSKISNLTIYDVGDGQSLLLKWNSSKAADLMAYRVYIGQTSGVYDTSFTTTDTSFICNNLNDGTLYYLAVAAVDYDGYESVLVENSGIPYAVPLAPLNLTDEPFAGFINFSWFENTEFDLLGYNIYRSQDLGGTSVKLNSTVMSDTFFTDNTAQNGLYYYYTVRAVDSLLNESTSSEEIRSRVVSLDQGILIVDETIDGNGSLMNPTDAEVDSFYAELLNEFDFQSFDVNTEGGIKLADLGAYSTVIWHGDDYINQDIPFQIREDIKKYLQYGGNFLYSGYKPVQAFHETVIYPQNFSTGNFIHDMLKIQNVELTFGSRFIGANPSLSGYLPVYVDTTKTASNTNFHLRNIEGIGANNEGTRIYLYDTNYDTATAFGSMKGETVGVEYIGNDYKTVILSFPIYYMNLNQAKNMIQHILINKFAEPITIHNLTENLPSEFVLYQNYPNPFNPSITFEFALPKSEFVTLKVFNIRGQELARLVSEKLNSGRHKFTWNAENYSSGIYFYKLKT